MINKETQKQKVNALVAKINFTDNAFIDWGFRLKILAKLSLNNHNVS